MKTILSFIVLYITALEEVFNLFSKKKFSIYFQKFTKLYSYVLVCLWLYWITQIHVIYCALSNKVFEFELNWNYYSSSSLFFLSYFNLFVSIFIHGYILHHKLQQNYTGARGTELPPLFFHIPPSLSIFIMLTAADMWNNKEIKKFYWK